MIKHAMVQRHSLHWRQDRCKAAFACFGQLCRKNGVGRHLTYRDREAPREGEGFGGESSLIGIVFHQRIRRKN